ncbi:phosphatase PAP2 family protein [Flammeovirga kamogawensis]|uniref:Phosphatase PAP2 family protein n=1 Tax=Flammeovirga kamogawensis TaxID=373891 RepID=A0ABX8H0F9_9BACT|nr:phosphatase PAP2 family protein [Flammeovirga kamogawensis]MBB6459389.1 undecaprenyl-diphosphatase [Flammeovirga kamogawensis]QWG08946.1 phosphatase PAP2 family protein [Flammeovirga kamogawensis]TRX67237.1 phosphatase PAP2 family protein [Flammeovirga kamogawensis]
MEEIIINWAQSHSSIQFDEFLNFITHQTFNICFIILICFAVRLYFHQNPQNKINFLRLILVFGTSAVIGLLIKHSFFRLRPCYALTSVLQKTDGATSSFPSGHTTLSFAIFFSCVYAKEKLATILPLFLFASLVGYSRIALGVHYPTDILAGITLSFVVTILINSLLPSLLKNKLVYKLIY